MMKSKERYGWILCAVLSVFVVIAFIHQLVLGNNHWFTALLTLVLMWSASFILHALYEHVPPLLETMIVIFIVMAQILGGMYLFYVHIPVWDTLLHAMKGVWATAVGLSLPRVFRVPCRSALFTAIVAVCFTMTLGVLWEFGEFGLDMLFHTDTQKDWTITELYSAKLDPTMSNTPVHIVVDTVSVNGMQLPVNGYLDIGLIDTMKDLLVSFGAAVVVAVWGMIDRMMHTDESKKQRLFLPCQWVESDLT